MSLDCSCKKYADLELLRSAVEPPALLKVFKLLTESPDKLKNLYECDVYKQLWQESKAWGWDNWDEPIYLFNVPATSTAEWLQEQ